MAKPGPDLEERLVSGVLGAIFGAVIGFILAWLFGVHNHSMGGATIPVDMRHWILGSAGAFGLLGLILGSDIGTVIGSVFNGIYEAERREHDTPDWVWWVVVVVLAYFAWRWWAHA